MSSIGIGSPRRQYDVLPVVTGKVAVAQVTDDTVNFTSDFYNKDGVVDLSGTLIRYLMVDNCANTDPVLLQFDGIEISSVVVGKTLVGGADIILPGFNTGTPFAIHGTGVTVTLIAFLE